MKVAEFSTIGINVTGLKYEIEISDDSPFIIIDFRKI